MFQVWRLEKGTQRTYKLICENEIKVTKNKKNEIPIPISEQCKFHAGDVIGSCLCPASLCPACAPSSARGNQN